MKRRNTYLWLSRFFGVLLVPIIVGALGLRLEKLQGFSTGMDFIFSVVSNLATPVLWENLYYTVRNFVIGYLIAIFCGSALGVVMGRFSRPEALLGPSVSFLRALPSAIIIPLAMLLVAYTGNAMKIFVISYGAIWPVLLQVYHGSKGLDNSLIDTGKTLGKTRGELFIDIEIPSAIPFILSGGHIAIGIGLLLAVTTEMLALGDSKGIGYIIHDFERSYRYAAMLSGIVIIGLTGWLFDYLYRRLERQLIPWHPRIRNRSIIYKGGIPQ